MGLGTVVLDSGRDGVSRGITRRTGGGDRAEVVVYMCY